MQSVKVIYLKNAHVFFMSLSHDFCIKANCTPRTVQFRKLVTEQ